jgi:hypothetical protein
LLSAVGRSVGRSVGHFAMVMDDFMLGQYNMI